MRVDATFPNFIRRARVAAKLVPVDVSRALDAILYSALALEAFPSDLICLAEIPFKHKTKDLAPQLWNVCRILPDLEQQRVQNRTKYEILYYLLTDRTFDRGSQPYQDFDFLLLLRNELVHPKCSLMKDDEPYDGSIKRMMAGIKARGFVSHPGKPLMPWKMYLDNEKAATWAVETAKAMIITIIDAVPPCPFKRVVEAWRGPNSSMCKPL